jgi:NAD(P)-dependent dehydrogenase (short-subunit alcohol dehydrogenase family)
MVAISTVIASNARFAKEQHRGAVCVFAGATAGIGLETLKKMAVMLNSSTFYILGRTPSRFTSHLEELKMIGPSNQYQFIEAQVSLISEVDAVCQQITSSETKLDYLCMSSGGLPWAGASCMYTPRDPATLRSAQSNSEQTPKRVSRPVSQYPTTPAYDLLPTYYHSCTKPHAPASSPS